VSVSPKHIVATGYDVAAETYAAAARRDAQRRPDPRSTFLDVALGLADEGGRALDLGCGTGEHATAALSTRYAVVGVDVSTRSVGIAAGDLPNARFVVGDMARLAFVPESFELITAFYSLIHVPRNEHSDVLASAFRWLRPGGHLVVTMGVDEWECTESNWNGAPTMFWSHWGSARNRRLISDAGFQTRHAEEIFAEENGRLVGFLWIVAQRPAD
jgi:SAM-dependent methyltransferase